MFDITSRESFNQINSHAQTLKKYAPMCELILVGNKSDLDQRLRTVSRVEATAVAQSLGVKYFEVSALQGVGVRECFEELCAEIIQQ